MPSGVELKTRDHFTQSLLFVPDVAGASYEYTKFSKRFLRRHSSSLAFNKKYVDVTREFRVHHVTPLAYGSFTRRECGGRGKELFRIAGYHRTLLIAGSSVLFIRRPGKASFVPSQSSACL